MHPLNCPTIYGPVRSRRHGLSLGINLGSPENKQCTWSCLYCQCGFGRRGRPDPATLPATNDVIAASLSAAAAHPDLDSITFAGNSEPGLHPGFAEIAVALKTYRRQTGATWVLNCLSNGSEAGDERVLRAYSLLDESWIKLDCADGEQFRRLNRPEAAVGTIKEHLERIARVPGLRLQTLVWTTAGNPLLSNWNDANRTALLNAYLELCPRQIHLASVSREPAHDEVRPVPATELFEFCARARILGLDVQVYP